MVSQGYFVGGFYIPYEKLTFQVLKFIFVVVVIIVFLNHVSYWKR